ncbi:MAG: Polysaccharide deacetylase [Parcubacteria group bacterium ADurb.Bin159]|jgi:predicted deacetylase|nr:MAG: Polysaccharide deacetylase [Parcubacteria group bacterium ADurb.Bin159]
MAKYIFRIDDICPEMDWQRFEKLINIFNKYGVKPLLAVIPDNQDSSLKKQSPIPDFWEKVRDWQNKNYIVGMHGYTHQYANKDGGILKLHQGSEFAKTPLKVQIEKIKKGKEILENKGIKTDIFIAPAHSFDKNTVKALEINNFKYISDGIALWPFKRYNLVWIPQISGKVRQIPFGIITICLHSSSLNTQHFKLIENFIKKNQKNIIDFYWATEYFKKQKSFQKIVFKILNFNFAIVYRIIRFLKM